LLKEIHHRVKNNLTVISSLLDLQSSTIENKEAKIALQESQNRVRSIALIHQRLYQNEEMATLEIKGFVEDMYREIATVFNNPEIKVNASFNIPEIHLDLDTAVPLGLIINELFTNSFKYAFTKAQQGNINIGLQKIDEGNYNLTYTDNGPGLPPGFNFETSKTLGFRLIKILSKQLSGKAAYETHNKNTIFVIGFKDSTTRNKE
jgi:two-component sensor histidine kinase